MKTCKRKSLFSMFHSNNLMKTLNRHLPIFSSNYERLEDWLTDICTNDTTPKNISNYNIGLFEFQDSYVLFLVGTNTCDIDKTHSQTHNDFKQSTMYFKIPKTYYANVTRDALLEKLVSNLSDFTKTSTFKQLF